MTMMSDVRQIVRNRETGPVALVRPVVVLAIMLAVVLQAGAAGKKEPVVEPSYAWTVSEPLGLRYPSTIDTLFENYHRKFIPWLPSTAWATTGNYGAPGQNQVFMERQPMSAFFMEDAIAPWLHTTQSHRFYNTRLPMTLISYTTGGNKYSNQDRTQAVFSGNVNRRLQIGGKIDYVYSKGSYDAQADKDFTWGLNGSYTGDRYELQTFFDHYSYTTKESGGITDDRYITHPAEVQGGDTRVDNKTIPVQLSATQNSLEGSHFYMNHRYKVGFYRYRRDSVTDTITGRYYVPVTSFIWTMDYKSNRHHFRNTSAIDDAAFFPHTYLGLTGTDETTRMWRLRNTLGVSMLEGFNRYAKFGFSLYGTHEVRRYTLVPDTVTGSTERPEGLDVVPAVVGTGKTQNLLWVGGQLTKQRGSLLRYNATAQFGVLGDAAGEVDVTGDVATRFKLGRDTAWVKAYGYFKNLTAPWLMNNYVSNHYIWKNDFGKTQRFRVGGEVNVPLSWTRVNVAYETLKNYIYFGNDALPVQHSAGIHVFSVTVNQDLHFKAFNWENRLTFQTSSDEAVLPLPKLSLYTNLYLQFRVARVLHVQIGADCNYYTKYHAPSYNPSNMTFHTQNTTECGGFAMMDLYANFKLKRARFFVSWNHFNQKLFGGDNYFAIPHYPLSPRRFQLGVSVDFAN